MPTRGRTIVKKGDKNMLNLRRNSKQIEIPQLLFPVSIPILY